MRDIIYSNRRITSRYNLNLHSKISLEYDNKTYDEPVEIIDISFDGIQIVFSNNDFFFKYLDLIDNTEHDLTIQLEYEKKTYSFKHYINWIKIFNFGEKDFYVLSGLKFKNKKEIKNILLDLLVILQMKNIYIGQPSPHFSPNL